VVEENLTLLRASLSRKVTVDLDLSREPCLVEADRGQIQQVVMNILLNASEAAGDSPGRVRIRTGLTARTAEQFSPHLQTIVAPGSYAFLEVRDNGSGMTPETLKKIFDPFFTTKFTGRGLGLAAVLGIIKGHQGDIEVETETGQGATFRVLLPAVQSAAAATGAAAGATAAPAAGQTVLVVDDEEIVRNVASAALGRGGFRVLTAGNGAEALDLLRAEPAISLVILDLTMPVMSGEQALPLIQELRPGLPIVLSSGFSEAEIARRFNSAGLAGFLQKPYTAASILGEAMGALS
jgi:CheY-like chemotaxis protein